MPYDPMHTFDARSAYAGDYQFAPGVVEAARTRVGVAGSQRFFIRQISMTHPDYPQAAEALGLQSTQEVWEGWREKDDTDDLRPNDKLTIDETPATRPLLVRGVALSHYSRWWFSTTRTVADG